MSALTLKSDRKMKQFLPDLIAWAIGVGVGVALTSPDHRVGPIAGVTVACLFNIWRRHYAKK